MTRLPLPALDQDSRDLAIPGSLIESIEAWACRLELSVPISFGDHAISSREYVAVRLITADGVTSDVVGLSRRAPVDLAVTEVLAPHILGLDSLNIAAARRAMRRGTRALGMDGVVARGASLLELCLWDSSAQRQGEPVWQLLGGQARTLPVQLVEGYPLPDESPEAFAERIAQRVAEGYTAIKLELASEPDPATAGRKLALVRERVGPGVELVADMAYFWDSPDDVLSWAGAWRDAGLAWLEDPMPRDQAKAMARLRTRLGIPIGAGDESTRPVELADLLDHQAVDVLRIDLTTIGDLGAAAAVVSSAHARGVSVSAHVHPEVHRHIAVAWPALDRVEAFAPDRPFDLMHELIEVPFMTSVANGYVLAPVVPGLGLGLNLSAVRRTAYRTSSLTKGQLSAPPSKAGEPA
jgi:L-alanine-DL-glutamate epimerase-like enolase superfamily enzyme